MGIIQASIPVFLLLILAEVAWSWRRGTGAVRLNDALTDLSCGILSQLAGIFSKVLTLGIFAWVGERLAVQRLVPGLPAWPDRAPMGFIPDAPWLAVDGPALAAWAIAFVLVDFCYYWSHRLSHEVHLLWAGHVVHHSSEEYNLAVALRQSALHGLLTWVFFVPLALLGMPWTVFLACNALNLVYQFWIHTRAIGTLPRWAEWLLNTPSHHRVHHGINPEYQDRNYGGVFILFDRWFGTFEPEVAPPVYGITTPLRSWNPVWANVHVFAAIARAAWRAPSWRAAWQAVFGRPGAAHAGGGAPTPPVAPGRGATSGTVPFEKFDPPVPRALAGYASVQFAVALTGALALLRHAPKLSAAHALAGSFCVAVALVGVGGVFERAQWARALETARLLTTAVACVALGVTGRTSTLVAAVGVAAAVASLLVVWRYRRTFSEPALAPLM